MAVVEGEELQVVGQEHSNSMVVVAELVEVGAVVEMEGL